MAPLIYNHLNIDNQFYHLLDYLIDDNFLSLLGIFYSGINRNIYYYCRRRERGTGGVFLGSLGPEKIPDLSIEDIPILEENDGNIEMGTSIVDIMKSLSRKKEGKKKAVILTDFLKI